jgi:hypothetical protein
MESSARPAPRSSRFLSWRRSRSPLEPSSEAACGRSASCPVSGLRSCTAWVPIRHRTRRALGGVPLEVAAAEVGEDQDDGLAGDDVQEEPPGQAGEGAREQDPPPGVEPAVQGAARAQVGGARAPRPAHGAEAEEVDVVVGEDALGDRPRRPGRQVRPVSLAERLRGSRRHVESFSKPCA